LPVLIKRIEKTSPYRTIFCLVRSRSLKKISSFIVLLLLASHVVKTAECKEEKISTVHQTVWSPVVDGVSQVVPGDIGNQQLAALGFVDVTGAPFFADPTGKKDVTQALQRAVNFARDHQMVCYFPSGDYRISDTLSCIQNPYLRSNGEIAGGPNFPCVLTGSYTGPRPTIHLAAGSPGYGDPGQPKYVIHFWARGLEDPESKKPNVAKNQMLINLNIVVGENNPGAVALRHRGAQGSAVQDCTIDVTHGLTGIEGGIGSGGSLAGITVIGGKIGMDLRETQPATTITGITLIRQTETAILYEGRQSLCAVGIKIISTTGGPLVKTLPAGGRPTQGQACMVDSEIVFEVPGGIAISAAKSLFLSNVYAKGASKVVSNLDGSQIPGRVEDWVHIVEYAHGVRTKKWRGYQFEAPVYTDGKRRLEDLVRVENDKAPPPDLQRRHVWTEDFPHWESPGAVNVKAPPYLAKGDGKTDDTIPIQKAIDQNEIVFLPKGYYCITKPIQLKPHTKLVGAARHLSIIMVRPSATAFANPQTPKPLVESSDLKDAPTVISFCGLYVPNTVRGAYALKWQCGEASVVRDVNFITQPLQGYKSPGNPEETNTPLVRVMGNGGGRWYNFFQEGHTGQGPGYRHMLVCGADGPLAIYQCNPEHALSDANMEIRSSRDVSIFGLKSEGNRCIIKIADADRVRIFGYGGNAAALEGQALFMVEGTPNFLFANLVDAPRLPPVKSSNAGIGRGVDPTTWFMIAEEVSRNEIIKTKPLDRPVLYRRGNPAGLPETAAGQGSPSFH
jgi:hypothetical protein